MGRKKSTRKPTKRIKVKLDTQFNCLKCNQEGSVGVKMNRDDGSATLMCTLCNVSFSSAINNLSAPVDIYHEWVDNYETIEAELDVIRSENNQRQKATKISIQNYQYEEDEEDDEIVNDEDELDLVDQVVNETPDEITRTLRNRVISESDSE